MREGRPNIVRDLRMIIDHQWYGCVVCDFQDSRTNGRNLFRREVLGALSQVPAGDYTLRAGAAAFRFRVRHGE